MRFIQSRPVLVLVLVAVVSILAVSCGDDATVTSDAGTDDAGRSGAPAAPGDAGTSAEAAWKTLSLTDVSGEQFTFASLSGGPVFVENFATWCSNCRQQLNDTQAAAAEAGDAASFVALSVETDLSASDLADYAKDNGYDDIRFAVMTPEFLAAMSDAFGKSSLNPPSTPKFLLGANGTPGDLVTGFESTDDILAKVRAA